MGQSTPSVFLNRSSVRRIISRPFFLAPPSSLFSPSSYCVSYSSNALRVRRTFAGWGAAAGFFAIAPTLYPLPPEIRADCADCLSRI